MILWVLYTWCRPMNGRSWPVISLVTPNRMLIKNAFCFVFGFSLKAYRSATLIVITPRVTHWISWQSSPYWHFQLLFWLPQDWWLIPGGMSKRGFPHWTRPERGQQPVAETGWTPSHLTRLFHDPPSTTPIRSLLLNGESIWAVEQTDNLHTVFHVCVSCRQNIAM